jgi:hypothetical protein
VAINANLNPAFRGESYTITWTHASASDITGWSITFAMYTTQYSTTAVLTKTVGSGVTLTDPTIGVATITLSAANLTIAAGTYYFVVSRTDAGYESQLTYGNFEVKIPAVAGTA